MLKIKYLIGRTVIRRCSHSKAIRNVGILAHIDAGKNVIDDVHPNIKKTIMIRELFQEKLQLLRECCFMPEKLNLWEKYITETQLLTI